MFKSEKSAWWFLKSWYNNCTFVRAKTTKPELFSSLSKILYKISFDILPFFQIVPLTASYDLWRFTMFSSFKHYLAIERLFIISTVWVWVVFRFGVVIKRCWLFHINLMLPLFFPVNNACFTKGRRSRDQHK